MKQWISRGWLIFSIVICALGCQRSGNSYNPSEDEVNNVLDDWHNAAAQADFERYFGHFAGDSAIFMGTDATERWTIAEFKPWSKPYFDRGRAWNFTPVERYVYFSDSGETAWFDESLDTPNLGPARGDRSAGQGEHRLENCALQPVYSHPQRYRRYGCETG